MRRIAIAASVIALAVFTVGVSAQGKPNFTGKWVQSDPDPAAAAAGGGRGGGRGGGWGTNPAITQDATALTVEYMAGGQNATAQKFTVKLDGSETKNSQNMGGNAIESVSKATWEGPKLVVNTVIEFNGNKIETKRELWLESGNLIIQTTAAGRGGAAPTPVKITYKKAS